MWRVAALVAFTLVCPAGSPFASISGIISQKTHPQHHLRYHHNHHKQFHGPHPQPFLVRAATSTPRIDYVGHRVVGEHP